MEEHEDHEGHEDHEYQSFIEQFDNLHIDHSEYISHVQLNEHFGRADELLFKMIDTYHGDYDMANELFSIYQMDCILVQNMTYETRKTYLNLLNSHVEDGFHIINQYYLKYYPTMYYVWDE